MGCLGCRRVLGYVCDDVQVRVVVRRVWLLAVGNDEAIVFGSIRWCVWSVRPSSPLRLPHLKCLLLLFVVLLLD